MRNPNLTPDSSKHSVEPTNVGEYQYPTPPEYAPVTPEDENDPDRPQSKRRLFTAIGAAGAAAGLATALFIGTQGNATSERPSEPREPGTSAPAVPGETDPSGSAEKETQTAAEMIATFESQVASNLDKEIEAQPGVNYEQDDRKVSLDVLRTLSDWTMTGVTKENLAAYNKMSDAKVDANLSVDDFNSVPGITEASSIIADKVAEKQLEKLGFEKIDEDTQQILHDINANNLLAGLTALNDKTGEVKPFEAGFNPLEMTQPFNYNGTHSFIKFEEWTSGENKYKKDLLVRDQSGQAINFLAVAINEEGDNVKRVRMTEIPPAQPMEKVEPQY